MEFTHDRSDHRRKIALLIALIALLAPLTWYGIHQYSRGHARAHSTAFGRMAAHGYYPVPSEQLPAMAQPASPAAEPAAPAPIVTETLVPKAAVHATTHAKAHPAKHATKMEPAEVFPMVTEKPLLIVPNHPAPIVHWTPPAAAAPKQTITFPASLGPPRLAINQTNLLHKQFKLTSTLYWLNGNLLNVPENNEDSTTEGYRSKVHEGTNVLLVQATARGLDEGPLRYLHAIDFAVTARRVFTARAGEKINVDSILFEDDDLSKEMATRLRMEVNISTTAPDNTPLADN